MTALAQARSTAVQLGVQGVTIETAIDHLVDAAQGVVENQLELARLEVELAVSRVLSSGVLIVVGAILLGMAAVALAMAGYKMFPQYSPAQRLAVLAGASGVVGLVLAGAGLHRMGAHGRR